VRNAPVVPSDTSPSADPRGRDALRNREGR
jgi:hypothetical protein